MTALEPAARRAGGSARLRPVVVTRRNLIRMPRIPELIVFAVIQPVMFVVLFRYVFGGAITVPGGLSYASS